MGVISISIPDDLLATFDAFLTRHSFTSRSDGIRSAIQTFISLTAEMEKVKGARTFLSAYTFKESSETWARLESAMDPFQDIIQYSHDFKLGEVRSCIVLSRGHVGDVERMHERLGSTKDVQGILLNLVA